MQVNCYLGFYFFFEYFENSKKESRKVLFSKQLEEIFELKNFNICERALSGVYVYKISSRYFGKWPSVCVLKIKNGHFHAFSGDFCVFPIFKICPIWAVQKAFYDHFSRSWRKTDPKTCITPPKPKIFSLTSLWPRDLEWPWPWICSQKA